MDYRSIICLLAGSALLGCRGANATASATPAAPPGEVEVSAEVLRGGEIKVEPVAESVEGITLHASGKAAFDEDHLGYVSAPLAGRVVEIDAQPGQHVEAGQTLAVVDSPDLGTASSELIKASADLVLAEREAKLADELFAAKAMARKDFQRAQDDLIKAKADLRRAREHLVSLGVPADTLDRPPDQLHVQSRLGLTSPVAGTIVERTLTLGQMVGGDPAQRLFVVADLTSLWVNVDVYEKDLPLVGRGEQATIQTAAWPDDQMHGAIDYVGDTVDPASRTVKVRIRVDNAKLLLKPEMFVTAAIDTTATASVLTVPLAAVHGEGAGQPYVFAALADNRFARRAVKLGARRADRVVVAAGLSAADRVATEGSILLKAEAERQSQA
ncbi:MAG TPA: efflux RND transporter periplasmic adaptor subunit [Candidatus Bathyarchaeia archaeon]|nr:efflux RND transporter periplasmic adaptor subunit [Candidatus Bathyarchaeia archaeon]